MNYLETYLLFSLLFFLQSGNAQTGSFDLSFDFQAYPTGLIPGIRIEKASSKSAGHLRLGYQWIRHGSAGKHEDERGRGFGFSLGYKRYLKEGLEKFHIGLKNDTWFNSLDWKNGIGTLVETKGKTDIIVTQPTIELGYLFRLNKDLIFSPTLALGYEINVRTRGEPTGEGTILLIGFNLGQRFGH